MAYNARVAMAIFDVDEADDVVAPQLSRHAKRDAGRITPPRTGASPSWGSTTPTFGTTRPAWGSASFGSTVSRAPFGVGHGDPFLARQDTAARTPTGTVFKDDDGSSSDEEDMQAREIRWRNAQHRRRLEQDDEDDSDLILPTNAAVFAPSEAPFRSYETEAPLLPAVTARLNDARGNSTDPITLDPERLQAIKRAIDMDPRMRFAGAVAGYAAQATPGLLISQDEVARATRLIATRISDLERAQRRVNDQEKRAADLLSQGKHDAAINTGNAARFKGRFMPELGRKVDALTIESMVAYTRALSKQSDIPGRERLPTYEQVKLDASFVLDDVVRWFASPGALSPPDASDTRVGDLRSLSVQIKQFAALVTPTGMNDVAYRPPNTTSGTSTVYTRVLGFLIRVNLGRRAETPYDIIGLDGGVVRRPSDADGSIGNEMSNADERDIMRQFESTANGIRSSLFAIANISSAIPTRPPQYTQDTIEAFSGFITSVLAVRAIEYSDKQFEEMLRGVGSHPRLLRRDWVISDDNKEAVRRLLVSIDAGETYAQAADTIITSILLDDGDPAFPPASLFSATSAFYERNKDLIAALAMLPSDSFVFYDRSDKSWDAAIAADPRVSLWRLWLQYSIVRDYMIFVIDQLITIPDLYNVKTLFNAHDKIATERTAVEGSIRLLSDKRQTGIEYARLPEFSGAIEYTRNLQSAISAATSWLVVQSMTDYKDLNFDIHILGLDDPENQISVTHVKAGSPTVLFYDFFARLTGWWLKTFLGKAGYMTIVQNTDHQKEQRELVDMARLFRIDPRTNQIVYKQRM